MIAVDHDDGTGKSKAIGCRAKDCIRPSRLGTVAHCVRNSNSLGLSRMPAGRVVKLGFLGKRAHVAAEEDGGKLPPAFSLHPRRGQNASCKWP